MIKHPKSCIRVGSVLPFWCCSVFTSPIFIQLEPSSEKWLKKATTMMARSYIEIRQIWSACTKKEVSENLDRFVGELDAGGSLMALTMIFDLSILWFIYQSYSKTFSYFFLSVRINCFCSILLELLVAEWAKNYLFLRVWWPSASQPIWCLRRRLSFHRSQN